MASLSERAVPTVSRGVNLEVHLIDGTYELFRHYHALPSMRDSNGQEVAAVRGVITSILGMIQKGATHLGVATDHVIESFRNKLWADHKTGEGIEPELWAQFPLLEEALTGERSLPVRCLLAIATLSRFRRTGATGRRRRERFYFGGNPASRPRTRFSISRSGDPSHGHTAFRVRGETTMDWRNRRLPATRCETRCFSKHENPAAAKPPIRRRPATSKGAE
jgi:hypothetical protein